MLWPIGACAWIFGDRPLAALARELAGWGYDGLEISGEPDRYDAAPVRRILQDSGLLALGVTASCNWPTEERDLANPEPGVRRRAVDHFRRCVDLAREVGAPTIGLIPGAVGRIRAFTRQADEWRWSVEATRQVADHAAGSGVTIAVEALNRYETHLVNTAAHAVRFVEAVGSAAVGVELDAYHMNIEEADPAAAIRTVGDRLRGFHVADNTRGGLGDGRLDLRPHLAALRAIGYQGPLIVECTAPGPDPFQAIKDGNSLAAVQGYVARTLVRLQTLLAEAGAGRAGR